MNIDIPQHDVQGMRSMCRFRMDIIVSMESDTIGDALPPTRIVRKRQITLGY